LIPLAEAADPAVRLLLAAGRAPGPGGAPPDLAAAAAAVRDWDEALATAARHGVLPLLARALAPPPPALPPPTAARLRAAGLAATATGLFLLRESSRLVALLAAHGIPALPWKGAALAAEAYGDPGLRSPSDLDLLVRRRDALRAGGLLEAEGFAPGAALTPRQARAFVAGHAGLAYTSAERGVMVDLGWALWEPDFRHPLTTDLLLGRARTASVAGFALPALPPADLLLALCFHGAKHRWSRLVWARDVAGLLARRPEPDPGQLLAEASRLRLRRALLGGCTLAAALFGAPLPPPLERAALADPHARRLGADAGALAARAGSAAPRSRGRLGSAVADISWRLRALDTPRDRASCLLRWAVATNTADWAWVRLPDALFPLYGVLRPLRLLLRAGVR
jgi:hypothetical protein